MRRSRATGRWSARVTAAAALAASLAWSAGAAGAASQAPGTGKPNPGTGINTQAAFDNPLCRKDAGPYGQMDFVFEGAGPVCIAAWKKGTDNGGATYQGVTKDAIHVAVLAPNAQQYAAAPRKPVDRATGQPATAENTFKDTLTAFEQQAFETYGRKVTLDFVTSTGSDEAAQRADAVTVQAEKPFAVLDAVSLEVFDTVLAAAKVPVWSTGAPLESTLKQAPYRWGQIDLNAAPMNMAEFVGKQLAGKKAQWAGDAAMHDQTRKFGMVYSDPAVDVDLLTKTATKFGLKFAPGATVSFPSDGSNTVGDATTSQAQAPNAIAKLKSAGVTTVVLLVESAMVSAMTKQATAQDYHPEWIFGYNYNDLPILARGYDQDQWSHALGLTNLPVPGGTGVIVNNPLLQTMEWYWGPNRGSYSSVLQNLVEKFMFALTYAGPKLTPKTVQQGLFSVPGFGGSASGDVYTIQQGWGRTSGLPYDEYNAGNKDFTAAWWEPNTTYRDPASGAMVKGALYYMDDFTRHFAGQWPTKAMKFFDTAQAKYQFGTRESPLVPVPCTGCPSAGGPGTPAASAT